MMGINHVDLTGSPPRPPPPPPVLLTSSSVNNIINTADREEGEIIEDEYEEISSDEEFTMRKRIEELEARNAELEKIANISGLYGNYEISSKKDVGQHEIDVCCQQSSKKSNLSGSDYCVRPSSSSISLKKQRSNYLNFQKVSTNSTSIPKKYTHRRHYHESRSENSNCTRSRHDSSQKGRKQSSSPELIFSSHKTIAKCDSEKRTSRNGSGGNSRNQKTRSFKRSQMPKKSQCDYEILSSSDDDEFCAVNRDKLRLAIKRNPDNVTIPKKNVVSLDKKLLALAENCRLNMIEKKDVPPKKMKAIILSDETLVIDDNSTDDSFSLEEQELRLIALKSAVVKKHLARKKRKENDEKKPYSPSDFDNMKITPSPNNSELLGTCNNSMDVSPIESPELVISELDDNTKPIDMDLVNSSDSDTPIFVGQERWMPIQEIPLPLAYTELQSTVSGSNLYHSPQPRKLQNMEETQQFLNSLNHYDVATLSNEQDSIQIPENMDIVDEKDPDNMEIVDENYLNDNTKIIISESHSPEPTDEEELALRALLLSKMNSPRVSQRNSTTTTSDTRINLLQPKLDINLEAKHSSQDDLLVDENLNLENEVDALRNLILSSMKSNKTALVLKEAVRRLKKTKTDSPQLYNEHDYHNQQNPNNEDKSSIVPDYYIIQNNVQGQFNSPLNVSNEYFHDPTSSLEINQNFQHLSQQQQQHELLPPFYENVFQPIFVPNNDFNPLKNRSNDARHVRHALKVIPITHLEKSKDVLQGSSKVHHSNDNLINVPLKNVTFNNSLTRRQSPNLKNIPLIENEQVNELTEILPKNVETSSEKMDLECVLQEKNISNEDTVLKETNDIDQEEITNIEPQLAEEPIITNKLVKVSSPLKSDIVENETVTAPQNLKLEQSLAVSKKIASLKKLSNSIQQTTEISKKTNIPLTKKPTNMNLLKKAIGFKPTEAVKKIVNTHKVINQNSNLDLKRKSNITVQNYNEILKRRKTSTDTVNVKTKSRLITNIETPTVNKMIISLGLSSTDDSDESDVGDNNFSNATFVSDLSEDITAYIDNASPRSVQMESPCYSPISSSLNSPNNVPINIEKVPEENTIELEDETTGKKENNQKGMKSEEVIVGKSVINDVFQAKLHEFLKKARTKVESNKIVIEAVDAGTSNETTPATPVAVRHLPASSQLEYRRLVSRMKILEKQKQIKNPDVEVPPLLPNFKVTIRNEKVLLRKPIQTDPNPQLSSIKKTFTNEVAISQPPDTPNESVICKVSTNISDSIPKNRLVKEQKNSVPKSSSGNHEKSVDPKTPPSIDSVNNTKNLDLLRRYEQAYKKNGSNILESIQKTLLLVKQGKAEKTAKHKLQKRLERLRKEMLQCETDLSKCNDKISKVYPAIIIAHQTIGNLKMKRVKLNRVTTALGRNINGEKYRLTEENNPEISDKFKNLAMEIKLLKNLKISDMDKEKLCSPESLEKTLPKMAEPIETEIIDQKATVIEIADIKLDNELNNKDSNPKDEKAADIHDNNIKNPEIIIDDYPKTVTPNTPSKHDNGVLYEKHCLNIQLDQKNHINFKYEPKTLQYNSPLDYQMTKRDISVNPYGIMCPYQLMGQCDDKDCKYEHLLLLTDDDTINNHNHDDDDIISNKDGGGGGASILDVHSSEAAATLAGGDLL